MITHKFIRDHLHYSIISGRFYWIKAVSHSHRITHKEAGSLNDKDGRRSIYLGCKQYQCGRLAWFWVTGKWPKQGLEVDHINHVRSYNAWINLRAVTHTVNCRNKIKYSSNSSGHSGVNINKKSIWVARINTEKGRIFLGSSKDKDVAIGFRREAEIKYNYNEHHGADAPDNSNRN